MHGDEVQFRWFRPRERPLWQTCVLCLRELLQTFLGIYHDAGPLGAVVPLDSRIQRDFFVLPEDPSVGRHYVLKVTWLLRASRVPNAWRSAITIERRVGSAEDLVVRAMRQYCFVWSGNEVLSRRKGRPRRSLLTR